MSAVTGLPALDNTMGALFVGVVFAMSLWGAGSVQAYYYFNRYRSDNWEIKLLVSTVWILDTVHQGLITHTAYTYLITNYGNAAFLGVIVSTLLVEVVVSALICFLVQSFFVMRIWRLSNKNIWLVGGIMMLVLTELVLFMVYTGKAWNLHTFANLPKLNSLNRSINGIGAATDITIAATLIWLLNSSRTGFSKSDTIINRLIMFSMNTGLLTSLCALTSLITVTVLPKTFVYIGFFVTVSRLYTNSLLATLNARKGMRGGHPDDSENMSLSAGHFRGRVTDEAQVLPKTSATVVNVKMDTQHTSDFYPQSKGTSDHDLNDSYHAYPPKDRV